MNGIIFPEQQRSILDTNAPFVKKIGKRGSVCWKFRIFAKAKTINDDG